ncbi:hypothetical protein A9179_07395 [Pseudomonas alcaligenes]|uniref:Type II secretion system protein GspC N-terminal domain-containing protein n=1 Tax=Aquipseudomonas alcaligenes TaxID=43263 RepID=A0ABR7S0J3_AQUAC|nr:type II secretion system protein N [Pseudomonas alcaligenes]MBC9250096.1 hypothetical protein [Pseudomonas alcaligenes]
MSATSTRLADWLRRHGVTGLCILAILVITHSLTRQTLAHLRLLRDNQSSAPAPTQQAPQQNLSLQQLQGLFGTPARARGDQPAPPTNQQLTLLGSFVNPDEQRSAAIIQVAGNPPRRLLVGAQINSSTRLRAVLQDHVLLERNGREESLGFPKARQTAVQPSSASYEPMAPTAEQIEMLQSEDVQALQQRMQTLQQHMESDGSEPPQTAMPEAEVSQ